MWRFLLLLFGAVDFRSRPGGLWVGDAGMTLGSAKPRAERAAAAIPCKFPVKPVSREFKFPANALNTRDKPCPVNGLAMPVEKIPINSLFAVKTWESARRRGTGLAMR